MFTCASTAQHATHTAPSSEPGSRAVGRLTAQQLLDAVPDAAAVLDRAGEIVAVNQTWRAYAAANGCSAALTGAGANFREMCARAAAAGNQDAARLMDQLTEVDCGESLLGEIEYEYRTRDATRWFMTRVTPLAGTGMTLITHVDITRQKLSEASLRELAEQDPLTGLVNRVGFLAATDNAERDGVHREGNLAMVYLDLDGFKAVNDSYGHACGDELLQVVSQRLRAATKRRDVVARLGGDEFAVLAWDTSAEELEALAERLTRAISRPMSLRGRTVTVGASTGTTMCGPGGSIRQTLEAADAAMYAVKKASKSDQGPQRTRAHCLHEVVDLTQPSRKNSRCRSY